MSLVALAAIAGGAQFGASVLGGIGQARQAQEMRRRAERAARYARQDASEDLRFASRQMDSEEEAMRLEASVTRRRMELQERSLGAQAMEEHGMRAVAEAMRGVTGGGTQRSFQRQLNQSALAFQGLGLERTAAFGRERRNMEMMNLGREQMYASFNRTTRDIELNLENLHKDADQVTAAAKMGMVTGAIEGASTAGLMMYHGGAFGGNAGKGIVGAAVGGTGSLAPNAFNRSHLPGPPRLVTGRSVNHFQFR